MENIEIITDNITMNIDTSTKYMDCIISKKNGGMVTIQVQAEEKTISVNGYQLDKIQTYALKQFLNQ